MEFPYISTGEAVIRAVVSEEKDKFLALASLAELGKYIPNIDGAKNVDLLGIAFNIFVANRINKNDDVSDSETSIAIAKLFVNKPINIEHKRERVVGAVLNYAFTQFGSNKALTEEEALASKDPFNVTLGGIIWRIVNPKLAKFIEECSDPTSESFEKVSASWEVGFLDFAIAVIEGASKNLADAEIITEEDKIKELQGYMKAYSGKGFKGNKKLYRLIQGKALPLGVGLTGSPAAEVSGVVTETTTDAPQSTELSTVVSSTPPPETTTSVKTSVAEIDSTPQEISIIKDDKLLKNISQNKEIVVIQERKALAMSVKITKLEDITDDLLKEAHASEITEWVKSQLKTADETYQSEKSQLENQIKASKEASDKLMADQSKLQEDLKKVTDSLTALQLEQEARAKQEAFNVRMGALDGEFELVDAEREIIASDIAQLDDTGFNTYKKKLDVLLAAKKKSGACAKCKKAKAQCQCTPEEELQEGEGKKKDKKTCQAAVTQTAQASTTEENKTTVEAALENAEKDKQKLAAAATASEPTWIEKAAKAFGVDQWISDIKLTD